MTEDIERTRHMDKIIELSQLDDYTAMKRFESMSDQEQKVWLFFELRKVNGRARDAAAVATLLQPVVEGLKASSEHEAMIKRAVESASTQWRKDAKRLGTMAGGIALVAGPVLGGLMLKLVEVVN